MLLKPKYWKNYKLLKIGDGIKIEQFGEKVIVRPELEANSENNIEYQNLVKTAHHIYKGSEANNGYWKPEAKENWIINYKSEKLNLKFNLFTGTSKHIGIFPEQAVNWEFIASKLNRGDKFLNLFAYTGGASIAASYAGGEVTHVDSVKQMVHNAKINAEINNISNIRFIIDDAYSFCKKELKRGNTYKAIILDPPIFGYGNKNKNWKLERDIEGLLITISKIIDKSGFIILNTYTPKFVNENAIRLLKSIFTNAKIKSGKLFLEDKNKDKLILNDYFIIEK